MWRNPLRLLRARTPRLRPITRARLALEALEARLAPATNVLTFHNDLAGTGLNPGEVQLTPANVKVGSFGKLFSTPVDGQVYAQPLVDTGVTILAGPHTSPGAAGTHDVVFVATEHDSLYAIDTAGGAVLWKRSFLDTSDPTDNTLGATAITTPTNTDVNSGDISPEIGITGTPVIDPATNTLYLVAKTKETVGGATHFVQRLHALNLADGTDRATPYVIGDTTDTNTNGTPIYVYGSGDGSVTDPYNGTGRQVVQFNALREHQRGALSFVNNTVYVEWASHGDNGPYHGWVAKWDVSNLATAGFRLTGVLNTSPNNGLAGIWQGGGRLAFEPDGSAFYFETGNGSGGAPTLNPAGFPANANYNEALVKVVADPASTPTSQNANGWGLKVADYFIPYNVAALDGADSDFGSGAPLLLPDSAGIPGHPHLMVAAGKEGKIYLVDRDNLGHFDPNNDRVLNAVSDGSGHLTPPKLISGSLSTPAFFNGTIYWVSGYSGNARSFTISSGGTLSATSQTSVSNFGYLPGSPSVSANGTTDGIVWVMDRNANLIRAYDATTLATELWDSGQKSGGGDNLGAVVKFATPTVADGEVFVGTTNSLVVYGLTPPANAVPLAPTLSATALSGSSINLTWTDPTPAPNTATGYKVEQSTDGTTFTQVTTAPAGATSVAVGGLAPLTTYSFRIRGFNGLGNSAYSNTASATTTNQVSVLDFSAGFAGSTSKLTYNGSAAINGTKAELTSGGLNQAGSVFSTDPVDVTRFDTQFSFQLTAGASTADGITFTIQGVGATALGPSGGGLGYGPDHVGGTGGIASSVAVKFDLYNNQGEGVDSTGLYTGGAAPTNVGSVDLTPSGVDLHSGHVFNVDLSYDGTTLTETIADATDPTKKFTTSYKIDIPGTVGGTTAHVGFTGGTGGLTATQDVLTWTFAPRASTSPNAPSGLGATPASATSVSLTWTNNATNQTGFHLDRATDAGFTQNLITESLPASPNSFTDTATGLAPGGTFYYRLRAFNSAGDSGNSNVASVTIPLAPPRPTDQQVTGLTTTEIDLSWTDNAGQQADGYKILRSVNRGAFTQVATLPPTSRTPPSTYQWSDTGLTPGTYYEYHIIAYNVSGKNDFAGVNATTLTDPPGGLTATPGNASVSLTWTPPAGAVGYNVYRGTSAGGEGAAPVATGVTATSYTDTGLTNGTTYFYKVTAVNANAAPLPNESAPSAEASATPSSVAPPAAPAGLKASGTASNTPTPKVVLGWSPSAGATSYRVYRSLDGNGEGGTPLATGVTGTSYTDTSVAFGTTYFYKVSAVNAGGEGPLSNEASATPLFRARVNFTAAGGDPVANYVADVGLAYGTHTRGLTYGWNQDNTANGRDRNAANSPDELHDSLAHMQKPNNPNAWWGIAVPNGTYQVHLIAGDPSNVDSVYRINVGGTLNPTTRTVTGGVLAVSGTPSSATRWFDNTVTVTVSGGVLYVSNASGSSNNKVDAITVTQVLAGAHFAAGFASTSGLRLNGSAKQSGTALRLTDGASNEAGSAFTASALDVARFTTSFDFRLTNPNADGITFTLQGVGATALGAAGGGLGYGTDGTNPGSTIGKSVAVKFDLYNNQGEGVNSTGLFLNGASPTNAGSVDLTGTGIDLHSGHPFTVTMSYDGVTLKVTIKDKVTGAAATQSYTVDIVKAVGGSTAFVGFTGGTGGLTATQDILAWDYSPVA